MEKLTKQWYQIWYTAQLCIQFSFQVCRNKEVSKHYIHKHYRDQKYERSLKEVEMSIRAYSTQGGG